MYRPFILQFLSTLLLTSLVWGQGDVLDDSGGEDLRVVITAVRGTVQVRPDESAAWVRAEVDMELGPGAEFRTGPRSGVWFAIPPDQIIALDRLGTVKVINAIKLADDKYKTDLGMKYGRTRYDIRRGMDHESKIYTPTATLSVRGSMIGVEDTPLGTTCWTLESPMTVRTAGQLHAIAMGAGTNFDTENKSVAATSVAKSIVNPSGKFNGQTVIEKEIVKSFNSNVDPTARSAASAKLRDLVTKKDLEKRKMGFVAGTMRIDLSWRGIGDLDLFLQDPLAQTIATFKDAVQGAVRQANGGVASAEHSGLGDVKIQARNKCDVNDAGCEFIRYNDGVPAGEFRIGAVRLDTQSGSANFDLSVKRNNVQIATLSDTFNVGDPPRTTIVTINKFATVELLQQ